MFDSQHGHKWRHLAETDDVLTAWKAVVQDMKGHYSPAHGLRAATQVQLTSLDSHKTFPTSNLSLNIPLCQKKSQLQTLLHLFLTQLSCEENRF